MRMRVDGNEVRCMELMTDSMGLRTGGMGMRTGDMGMRSGDMGMRTGGIRIKVEMMEKGTVASDMELKQRAVPWNTLNRSSLLISTVERYCGRTRRDKGWT